MDLFLLVLAGAVVACLAIGIVVTVRQQFVGVELPADASTPRGFEQHCANILVRQGWNARVTVASGDQGVDVHAEKSRVRVAIQCKLYSKPVGNKAVQEAFSGQHYIRGTHAAVVTNAGYTQSARELAGRTGVMLLNLSDLHRADALFGIASKPVGRTQNFCSSCGIEMRLPPHRDGIVKCPVCNHRGRQRT